MRLNCGFPLNEITQSKGFTRHEIKGGCRSFEFKQLDIARSEELVREFTCEGKRLPWLHKGHAYAYVEHVLLDAPANVAEFLSTRRLCEKHMKANTTWRWADVERQGEMKDRRLQLKVATTPPFMEPTKMQTRGACKRRLPEHSRPPSLYQLCKRCVKRSSLVIGACDVPHRRLHKHVGGPGGGGG